MLILVFSLLIVSGQNNQAEAYRLHVGSLYDGRQVYLLTETLRGSYYNFECETIAVGGYDVLDIHYTFWRSNGTMYYWNSLRGQNKLVSSSNIATNILNYFRNN